MDLDFKPALKVLDSNLDAPGNLSRILLGLLLKDESFMIDLIGSEVLAIKTNPLFIKIPSLLSLLSASTATNPGSDTFPDAIKQSSPIVYQQDYLQFQLLQFSPLKELIIETHPLFAPEQSPLTSPGLIPIL
jgi:hypothetical protein